MNGYPVTVRFPLHWGDMDALGHANNAMFFRWFETARIELFRGVGIEAGGPSSAGPILATTTCDFLQPVKFPGELVVGARVTKVGNTSLVMEYGLARAETPEVLVARGTAVVVLVNHATGEKVPVPDAVRDKIALLA